MEMPRWYIAYERHELSAARKMNRAMERLGIPMPPAPKTKREMFIRSVLLFAALGVAFAALYWAFNVN
jgi:hypothetical protein